MEVTNNTTSQFAPKLGQAASETFSSDAFSSHLAETDAYEAAQTQDQRRDDLAEERQANADKAASAEEDRKADAEDRKAEAEDRKADAEDHNSDDRNDGEDQRADDSDALPDELETDLSSAEADADALIAEGETNTDEDDLTVDGSAVGVTPENDDVVTSEVKDGSGPTTTNTNANTSQDVAQPLAAAQDVDQVEQNSGNTGEADELKADDLAVRAAQSTDGATNANAEAAAGATAQQAARQAQSANTQTVQNNTAATAGSGEQTTGLPNPLDAGLQGDTNAGGGDERGLGHQAAEAMAGKNKTAANATQPASNVQAVTAPTVTATPAVSIQALTTPGLNMSALPSDLNLDLLNLNAPNQAGPSGTPQNSNPVLVRFGALPGQAQATQVPNTAIALQISKHVAKGVSTFEIRLDPAEMGRVDVKLELAQDGRVTAHLTVEKAETLDLLQKDAKALEQALKDAGLDADADTLNFSLKNSGDDNAAGNQSGEADDGDGLADADSEAVLMNTLATRQIEAAARGGIDVSI